jgi:1-acyl-sn-glycerol-3-phosphate acyltransferase
MIRTVFVYFYVWLVLTFGVIFIVIILLLKPFVSRSIIKRIIFLITHHFTKNFLWIGGIKYKVNGYDNLPKTNNYCIVSNHQTTLDFLLITASFPTIIGFIAKKELRKIPIFNFWMNQIGCAFIDRQNKDEALQIISNHVKNTHTDQAISIFPEGTRSKSAAMNPFKIRGLQTIIDANAILVPFTIVDSYKHLVHGKIITGTVNLVIHQFIDCSLLSNDEKNSLVPKISQIINQPILESI